VVKERPSKVNAGEGLYREFVEREKRLKAV
jgi:hypothetical protein